MRIPEILSNGRPAFSFEFFLPKPPADIDSFLAEVRKLKELKPSYLTLTYGAAGSARGQTIETAGRMLKEIAVETACHLTCITHTKAEIEKILARLSSLGIENIVALRGDPPKDGSALPPDQRELPYGRDLVSVIRAHGGFSVAVAGYPETHPEAPSPEEDLEHLVDKVKAGGDWVITQLFFDNRDYFAFVKRARQAGVTVPIIPGIMPVTGYAQLKRFTAMCGAKLPAEMVERLEAIHEDAEAVVSYGIDYAVKQCRELLAGGAPGIHFYTLNRSRSTSNILTALRKAA